MATKSSHRQLIGATLLAFSVATADFSAVAAERVRFDSAAAKPMLTEFQRRRAEAAGQKIEPMPGDPIDGHVVKPAGTGPFPVVVYLHDCSGLAPDVKTEGFDPGRQPVAEATASPDAFFTSKLVSWGYAVVMPDSFATRNVHETCTTKTRPKQLWDAYGALAFVEGQPWADAKRIGVLGLSSGYAWHVARASDLDIIVTGPASFKAVVALMNHANCALATKMAAPTLAIVGGVLEPDKCIETVRAGAEGGAPVTYLPTPGGYGSFITSGGEVDVAAFRAWAGTTEAGKTVETARAFLDRHLKGAATN
jgi:dienelactone hydrolase